jgi:hypothetical protein
VDKGEELEIAAKLTEASGALAIPQEFFHGAAARYRLGNTARLAERAMEVAERIRASGFPERAAEELDEPLVAAILEAMAEETDPELQDSWENLLANALVEGAVTVRRAFPRILRELEPNEAVVLDAMAAHLEERYDHLPPERISASERDNLTRLGLIERDREVQKEGMQPVGVRVDDYQFTGLGQEFVNACRPPGLPD